MANAVQISRTRAPAQDYYVVSGSTEPLTDITVGNPGVATITDAAKALDENVGIFTATIAGVTGTHASSINGPRTCTRLSDSTFSIGVDTTSLTFVATAATITVQVAASGAGAVFDLGNKVERSFDYIG